MRERGLACFGTASGQKVRVALDVSPLGNHKDVAWALCAALDFWQQDGSTAMGPRIVNHMWGVPAGYVLLRPSPSSLSVQGLESELYNTSYQETLMYSTVCREAQAGLPHELSLLFGSVHPQ